MIMLGPPGPHFTCHRGLDGAFEQWKMATTNRNWYPNVGGTSSASLELIAPYVKGGMDEFRDYKYVPGLRSDDPADLILMYVRQASRRKWHGDSKWFRAEKRWVVLNPPTADGEGDRWSEIAEWIPHDEFTNRLAQTLRYLRQHDRPHWQVAEEEHENFWNH